VSVAIAQQIVNYLSTGEIKDAVNVPSIGPEQLEVLGPYLALCEKLGSLQGAAARGAADRSHHRVRRKRLPTRTSSRCTLAVLRGFIGHLLEWGAVNYVNAPSIARERGIKVVEAKTEQSKGFSNLVTVAVATKKGTSTVAGATFGRRVIRLVRINDFFLDADPEATFSC